MKDTKIQWCDDTVNFWSGCTKVSEGCANCYAETQAQRFGTFGKWGPGGKRKLHESAFKLAHRLHRKPWVCNNCPGPKRVEFSEDPGVCTYCGQRPHPRRIFSLSLGDWLDLEVPVEWLARMLATIKECQSVQWLLLTKRPESFADRLMEVHASFGGPTEFTGWLYRWANGYESPPHVWVGTSVENQQRAEERIPHLLRIPAAKHFLSCEPLLGPVDLNSLKPQGVPAWWSGRLNPLSCINWVIIGGESGPKARSCNVEWIRSLVAQCKAANVPCFVKQLGANVKAFPSALNRFREWRRGNITWPIIRDRKGGDMSEWPEDLRVREFPQ